MQMMPSGDLIGQNLVVRDEDFVLSGQSMNVVSEGLGVLQEDQQQTQDLRRLCLSLILIHIILGLGT